MTSTSVQADAVAVGELSRDVVGGTRSVRNRSSSSVGQADAAAVISAARATKLTNSPWKSAGVSSWRKAASFSVVCSSVVSHT